MTIHRRWSDLLDTTHGYQLTEKCVSRCAAAEHLFTCEKAQEKVFHVLGRWKLLKGN